MPDDWRADGRVSRVLHPKPEKPTPAAPVRGLSLTRPLTSRSPESIFCRRRQRLCQPVNQFPEHPLTSAVASKTDEAALLVGVQVSDRTTQAIFGVSVVNGRQGVVNALRPAFFLKCRQYGFLRARWHPVPLDDVPAKAEHAGRRIPVRNDGSIFSSCVASPLVKAENDRAHRSWFLRAIAPGILQNPAGVVLGVHHFNQRTLNRQSGSLPVLWTVAARFHPFNASPLTTGPFHFQPEARFPVCGGS